MSFNAYYNLQHSLDNAEYNEYRKLELLATSTASRLDQLIIDNQKIVYQVSTAPEVLSFVAADTTQERKRLQSATQSTLGNILRSDLNFEAVFLLDNKGKGLVSTELNFADRNHSSQEYFRQAIQGHAYASNILIDNQTKTSAFFISQPIWSDRSKVIGVAVLKTKEDSMNEIINRLELEPNSYAFLIDPLGIIINHPQKEYIYHSLTALSPKMQTTIAKDRRYPLSRIKSLDFPQLAEAMIGAKEPDYASYFSPGENKRQIVGFAPVEVQHWVLGISEPETTFAQPLNRLVWQNILNLLIIGAIAAIVALLLARSIARPIKKLTKVAQSLEKDNFEYDRLVSISHSRDDIGQLVRVFIKMAQQIESREQNLKQKVQKLNIEVDRAKKSRQVEEVTGTKYFPGTTAKELKN